MGKRKNIYIYIDQTGRLNGLMQRERERKIRKEVWEQKEDKFTQTEKLDALMIPEREKENYINIGRKCIKGMDYKCPLKRTNKQSYQPNRGKR